MPPFILPLLALGRSAASFLIGTRAGNIALAFCAAWVLSGIRHDHKWQAAIEAQSVALQKAHAEEITREAEVARQIAEDSVARADDDAGVMASMRRQIDDLRYQKEAPNVQAGADRLGCIDRDFLERVRRLDQTAGHQDRATRSSASVSDLRKAGRSSIAAQCRLLAAFALDNRASALLANRRLLGDRKFYDDVRRGFGANPKGARR